MELDLYYYFYVVCKCKSFSLAAKKLYVTQPAMSYAIKKLEGKLNKELILKKTKKFILTTHGEELYFSIKNNIENIEKIERDFYLKEAQEVVIKIGIPTQFAKVILLSKINEFTKQHKNIRFSIFSGPSKYLMQLLKNDEIELLIDCDPLDLSEIPDLNKEIVSEQKYIIIANKKFPKNFLSMEELLKNDVVVLGENSNCVNRIRDFFFENSYEFKPKHYFTTTDLIEDYVSISNSVGIVLEQETTQANIKKIDTNIELPTYTVYKVWKNTANNVVKAFLNNL